MEGGQSTREHESIYVIFIKNDRLRYLVASFANLVPGYPSPCEAKSHLKIAQLCKKPS
jgi:hypothetical protein